MRLLRPSALPTLRAAPRPRSKARARVVLHRPKTTRYTATMEPGAARQEQADFTNVAVTRYAATGHNGSAAVARLGLGSGQQTGPAKTLQVAKGDTITFTAYAWLTAVVAATSNSTSPKNPSLVLPAPQPNTAPPAAPGADGAPTKRSGLPTVGISVALPIGGPDDAAPQGGGAPGIARLHYRVLDEQGNVLLDDYQTANGATPATWQTLQVGLRLAQAGSVQLSVETNGAAGPTVYFDDVAVAQTGGLIVQEQHQYAFGAPLPGLSYTVGSTRYRHGYQGQYADKDEETGFDSFELRLYNSRIGRWMAPDPYGQFDSPYVGMGNNPVNGVDPDGGFFGPGLLGDITKQTFMLGEVTVTGTRVLDAFTRIGISYGRYAVGFFDSFVNDIGGGFPSYIRDGSYPRAPMTGTGAAGQFMGHVAGTLWGLGSTAIGIGGEFGGGALTLAGITAPAGIAVMTGSTALATYGGAVTLASLHGLGQSGRAILNMGKFKPDGENGFGGFKKNPQGFNTKKNSEVTSLYKQYKLTKEQQRKIHDIITGRDLTRKQIEQEIINFLKKK